MNTIEIKRLLQLYFNGETSVEEEKKLEVYFQSGDVAEEVKEYSEFFGGISELANASEDSTIEDDIMDFILENEHQEKTKYRWLWKTVTGIAASIIIVLGGVLFYDQQQKPFEDTFTNPDEAYAYAEQTLQFVSGKYNKGLAQLANFEVLQTASKPLKEGVKPVNDFFDSIHKMETAKESEQSQ